jgi:hypothetical protein
MHDSAISQPHNPLDEIYFSQMDFYLAMKKADASP